MPPSLNSSVVIPTPGLPPDVVVRVAHVTDAHVCQYETADGNGEVGRLDCLRRRRAHLLNLWGAGYEEESVAVVLNDERLGRVDALLLSGDMVDFPTPASIEWLKSRLDRLPVPALFTPGNHDWCFPGQTSIGPELLRDQQRPMLASLGAQSFWQKDLKGLRLIGLDNSTTQVEPDQLAATADALRAGLPVAVMLHVPVTLPDLRARTIDKWKTPILMGEPMTPSQQDAWRVAPGRPETEAFIRLIREAANVVAVFAGHVHFEHAERLSPTAIQYVGAPASEGRAGFYDFVGPRGGG